MASFFIPLTGLQADSTALNTIANDLSNMNTTAFKAQTTNFSNLFYQQVGSSGSGDPIEEGAGVQVSSNETEYTQGSINSTGNASNVALNGNGFFVVNSGNGSYEYTRDGDFSTNTNGNLVTAAGQSVMGYPAVNGVVNTNAPLTAVTVPVGQVQEPVATTTMNMTANLDADSTSGTEFPATVTVYDSLGEAQSLTVTYTPSTTTANAWDYSASLPASAYSTGTAPAPVTGTMQFSASGELTSITTGGTTTNVDPANPSIHLDLSPVPVAPATTTPNMADGASPLSITWNLLGAAGTPTISQVDTTSAVSASTQNGYPSGQYESFAIGSDGTITASYSNGQTQNVGQLALADVTNLQGLQLQGDGDYSTTQASGAASVGVSGSAGLATITGSALEASNVNISSEFSDLIIAQRAFEANAKSVTTFDTVTQDTINMVH